MEANPTLASWLVTQRLPIEQRMRDAMGPAAPRASGGEAETLRRFRTFTGIALHRGELRAPALDGLQVNERRMAALLDAWLGAACALAGPDARDVRQALDPLVGQFRQALRQTTSRRSSSGKPRAARRSVVAAIDRIADAFFAIDTVDGTIADANPAAGAMLGTARDTLLGVDFDSFVPGDARGDWQARLDAMAEGGDHERFDSTLADVTGLPCAVTVSLTAYPTRGRTLALAIVQPATAGSTRPIAMQVVAHTLPLGDPTRSPQSTPHSTPHSTPAPPPDPTKRTATLEGAPRQASAHVTEGNSAGPGFTRLGDGKVVPRRSASQLRRSRTGAEPGSSSSAPTRPQTPPRGTPPAGSRS